MTFFLRIMIAAISLCSLAPSISQAADPQLPIPPLKTKDIKVVLHTNTTSEKGGINKAVYYVRYLLDHYKRLGIPATEISMSVVFYGDGVLALFNDETLLARMPKKGQGNRSLAVLKELMAAGVSIEACSETMRLRKMNPSDLLEGVKTVAGSYVRVVDLQLQGYAYLKM